jgi:hypothetical protein
METCQSDGAVSGPIFEPSTSQTEALGRYRHANLLRALISAECMNAWKAKYDEHVKCHV